MTATNALATALKAARIAFRLDDGQELSGQANRQIRAANLRDARWLADISSVPRTANQLAELQALIESLDGAIGTFLLWNPARLYPQADPTGLIVGSSAVKINSVGANGKSFSLKALPAAYVLTRGDLIQVTYTSPLLNIALHRVIDASVTANGSGVTAEFEVRPHLLTGMAVDNVVNLKKPVAEFVMVPGSYSADFARSTGTIGFQASQVL